MSRVIRLAVAGVIIGSLLTAGAHAASAATDSMTVSDKSGTAQTNYPLQFARPFVRGEIANYPQVLVNGVPVTTQADVKQRWPDGSVKHAILSILVPSIPASGSVSLTFQNQADGNNTPLSQSDMLDPAFDFDAGIQIAAGDVTCSASARTMLADGNFTYWTRGPVATTIILADHSTSRTYDMGFDTLKSIRPIFEATFWPGINKVRVRFIGDNCNSETLEDAKYDITLTTGTAAPATIYTFTGFVHKAATRWTKVFWVGGAPESKINIDNNVAYLVQTRFFPMYDTSLTIPEKTINDDYNKWKTTAHDIQDSGWWCKGMGVTGGRDDIGHMPRWMTQWLYTGDYRSREIALGHADLAVNWPMQVREGNPTKLYDRPQTIPALGRPVSVCARGPLWIFDTRGGTNPSYWIPIQGTNIDIPNGKGGWGAQLAHQPDPFSLAYTVTGEHWYLEQVQMWAAWDILYVWPAKRGPSGYAGLTDEVRGEGWSFRNRVHAAFLSPDGTPEKDYFTTTTNDVIAHWEGWHGVNGIFTQHKLWPWARSKIDEPNDGLTEISPLHFMDVGTPAPWQTGFVMLELGVARDMGFATEPMAAWLGQFFIQQFLDPGYCVYRIDTYYYPGGRNADGTWMTTWAQMEQRCLADVADEGTDADARSRFYADASDTTHGYSVIASAATAVSACYPQADVGWNFMKANVRDKHVSDFSANPKFAINPRGNRLDVGPDKTYATIQAAIDAASDDDIIQIWSGTYSQEAGWAHINKNNLRIVGMGSARPVIDAGGSCLDGKGIFVISGYDTIIQNIEFANSSNALGGGAAAIRLQGMNLSVSGCYFHDSDNGIVVDDLAGSAVSIDGSEFNHNGYGDGASHNVSIGAVDSLSLRNCWIHNANGGCEVMTRAKISSILYNRIGNEGGNGTYEIQASNCGTTWIIGNQIEQSDTGTDDTMLACGNGAACNPGMSVYVINNTFVNNKSSGTFVNNVGEATLLLENNIFQGAGTVLLGAGTQTTNLATNDAGLRDPANQDFRLTPGSTGAINKGTVAGPVGDIALVPTYQYVHPCGYKDRVTGSSIDIGAYKSTPAIVVNAGSSQSIFRPAAANLNGSATGGDGPLTYTWSMASGPGTVTFGDASSPVTTATFSAAGIYTLQLTVSDTIISGSGTVSVNVDPPGVITDLAASNATPRRLILTWTAPGDCGNTGTAVSYDIRYSTSPITDANFGNATKLANPPTPAPAGLSENATVSGLSVSTTYYFAIKTTNHAGTVSTISNIATGQTVQVNMSVVAIKRSPGLADSRGLATTFANAVSSGTIPVYTGSDMVADCGSLSTDLVWYPQNIYLNYGTATQAASGKPILIKFGLGAVPNFAGSTINRAELRFYTWGGNQGMYNTGYITFSDWIEGTKNGNSPGTAGGVSGAHPKGYNTGSYQTADGKSVALNAPGFASWANGLPFAPSKDGVTLVQGLAHNYWGVTSGQQNQYLTIDVTPILQVWANGTPNYGMFIDSTGNYGPSLSETGTAEFQPTLFIEYYQSTADPTAPAAPDLGLVTDATVQILDLGTENNATTDYAVQEATTGKYVGPTGKLQVDPFWQARQAWSNVTVWGLPSQATCMFKSKARNTVAVESAYSSSAVVTTRTAGDINGDGYINVGDLQLLVAAWGSQAGPPAGENWNPAADISDDGYVNIADLQILVAHWNQ